MKNLLRISLVLGLVGVLMFAGVQTDTIVLAQEPEPDVEQEVRRISKNLYCPVCPGVPLDVCETQACVQWRGLIQAKLLAGESEDQIRQFFILQYGDRVLGVPPLEGFNLSAYLLPAFALVVGGGVLVWTARTWLRRRSLVEAPAACGHIAPEYAERIAQELRARE